MNESINNEYKISINITPKAFEGLARQGMLCHQGICELCDDALAAALPGEKARVCVALAPDADSRLCSGTDDHRPHIAAAGQPKAQRFSYPSDVAYRTSGGRLSGIP